MNARAHGISRRTILQALATVAGSVSLSGCERVISKVTRELGQDIPKAVAAPPLSNTIDPAFHLLSRASYGPWPGDLERVRQTGVDTWIEEQLQPDRINDLACDLRARRFETIHLDPGMCYEFKKEALRKDLNRHTLLRAVYSKRQLHEVMVGFWTDHLNISIDKGDCVYLKAFDDRTVIRKHALGRFKDLIASSATSPAMLVYLDGKENKKVSNNDIPNENYARELLELHTLGVHGGYCQRDVFEAARCLTGWRLKEAGGRGSVYFDASFHDDGEKYVLGKTIPAGGKERDVAMLVEIACNHPSTARHLAEKLARRFIGENAGRTIIDSAATQFVRSEGDIKAVLRCILTSAEFRSESARGTKLKRPLHYMASCLRFTGADTHAHDELLNYLSRMGQAPFQFPTPDGYPDESSFWSDGLLWRWNFALALAANQVPSALVRTDALLHAICKRGKEPAPEELVAYFTGRSAQSIEIQALNDYIAQCDMSAPGYRAELLGLVMASPAFQRY